MAGRQLLLQWRMHHYICIIFCQHNFSEIYLIFSNLTFPFGEHNKQGLRPLHVSANSICSVGSSCGTPGDDKGECKVKKWRTWAFFYFAQSSDSFVPVLKLLYPGVQTRAKFTILARMPASLPWTVDRAKRFPGNLASFHFLG